MTLTSVNPQLDAMISDTIPGMAHWAGSGPPGATCGKCAFLVSTTIRSKVSTRCGQYTKMMDGEIGPRPIPKNTRACKYFEPKA